MAAIRLGAPIRATHSPEEWISELRRKGYRAAYCPLDADAPERLERELLAFSRQMRCCVFVSDYIYADGGQYDAWTEAYRRGLARLDRALAAACENAAELCCAQTYWYKGGFDR